MTRKEVINAMVKLLCKKEKGKKQIDAGQAREILKILYTHGDPGNSLRTGLLYLMLSTGNHMVLENGKLELKVK